MQDSPDDSSLPPPQIRDAELGDLPRLLEFFEAYRVVYGQSPDSERASAFLSERLTKGDSRIFVAEVDGEMVGFVQLYPLLSSMAMWPVWLLNDIYVDESVRGRGVATALLTHSEAFAARSGAGRLELATARDNRSAQALYEKQGWIRDEVFVHYFRPIDRDSIDRS